MDFPMELRLGYISIMELFLNVLVAKIHIRQRRLNSTLHRRALLLTFVNRLCKNPTHRIQFHHFFAHLLIDFLSKRGNNFAVIVLF